MAIELINGDIFKGSWDVMGHGVNCKGGFGSGIAEQIAEKYPHVRDEYLKYHKEIGWELGDIQLVSCSEFFTTTTGNSFNCRLIFNCATQKEYMPRGVCHANYHAIERICKKLRLFCMEEGHRLALPKIGCGLAGGNWDTVEEIYENVFHDINVKVYYL